MSGNARKSIRTTICAGLQKVTTITRVESIGSFVYEYGLRVMPVLSVRTRTTVGSMGGNWNTRARQR